MSATRFSFSSFFTFSEGLNIGDNIYVSDLRKKTNKMV